MVKRNNMCDECFYQPYNPPCSTIEVGGGKSVVVSYEDNSRIITHQKDPDKISWEIKFRDGTLKRFSFPIK